MPSRGVPREREELPLSTTPISTEPKLSVVVATMCNYDPLKTPLTELARKNRENYCHSLNRCSLSFRDSAYRWPGSPSRNLPVHPSWTKLDHILFEMLSGRYDWVVWLDCDVAIMNMEMTLEDDFLKGSDNDAQVFTGDGVFMAILQENMNSKHEEQDGECRNSLPCVKKIHKGHSPT